MRSIVKHHQAGATLIVSMIMLVALTLLVVFAIRSANTNLRIAGNTQAQTEASAATQEAIEQTVERIIAVDDPSAIAEQTINVAMGAKTYTVTVAPMNTCLLEVPIDSSELDPTTKENDVPCIGEGTKGDDPMMPGGEAPPKRSECKTQQWEINARVDDGLTGARVEQVQGITIRVPTTVSCL